MNLLICTQAIDRRDPTLGFFHTWVERLADTHERITVLALRVGEYELPRHVDVLHVGSSRLARMWRVLYESHKHRSEYDAVFVHMSQEFILLAGWMWRGFGKKVYLWRNHYAGSFATDVAARQCTKVFYTSKFSYTAAYKNAVRMPVGIDTERFKRRPDILRDPRGILFLGRMAPSKQPHLVIEALSMLAERGVAFAAEFRGSHAAKDAPYIQKLHAMVRERGLEKCVNLGPAMPATHTPELFNRYTIFVNCSPSGMYDKVLFEAASCECVVVASSRDFAELVPPRFIFTEGDAGDLAKKLESLLTLPVTELQGIGVQMRNAARAHSLERLITRLMDEMR